MKNNAWKTVWFGRCALVIATLAALLLMICRPWGEFLLRFAVPFSYIFLGLFLLADREKTKWVYWAGVVFLLWFAVSRILDGEYYQQESYFSYSNLCYLYALAFPFAFVMKDGQRRWGLKAAFWIVVGLLTPCALGAIKWMITRDDAGFSFLPEMSYRLQQVGPDFRLSFCGYHPNVTGALFLMGFMGCLYLCCEYRKPLVRAILLLAVIPFYLAMGYTVSRTVMVCGAVMIGGFAFVWLLRLPLAKRWLRILTASALACVLLLGSYMGFDLAIRETEALRVRTQTTPTQTVQPASDLSTPLPVQTETVQPEKPVEGEANASEPTVENRPLSNNFLSFQGRTSIYEGVLRYLKKHPRVMLWGMLEQSVQKEIVKYMNVGHAHNSYLQAWMVMGLPGLLLSIGFAIAALWAALRLFFAAKDQVSPGERLESLMLGCLLILSMLENYLFLEFCQGYNSLFSMLFFLLLGTALERGKELGPWRRRAGR